MITHTLLVEKLPLYATESAYLLKDLRESLHLPAETTLRLINRYEITGLSKSEFEAVSKNILSEPQIDTTSTQLALSSGEFAFAYTYLPGQFDQRADSAAQAIQIFTSREKPPVSSSQIAVLSGPLTFQNIAAIKRYLINPVDSHEIPLASDLAAKAAPPLPSAIPILHHFLTDSPEQLRAELSLAMSAEDVAFTKSYFHDNEKRPPTLTEIRVLDTYWSDHCRHTTFLTAIDDVSFPPGTELIEETYQMYRQVRKQLERDDRPVTLMDIALIAMRELRTSGELDNLEVSEEINAASIVVPVTTTSYTTPDNSFSDSTASASPHEEEYLVQFKNETHNHPTEIEPFGGAATCLGGCIRDPLSGRSYVYQAMRVTGAANPLTPFEDTLPGKLPQRKICQIAAKGYSSYGNQIGLATGQVAEVYHPGYLAKRLEIGAVVAAAPRSNVFRGTPAPGDAILLIGGRTGRDGVGGATGSSKEHTDTALQNSAEVQKGDAPTERKIQRLFRKSELTSKIKLCNDFGAGGVSVAIGEIAPSLKINLDALPKKYIGLDGTELAISESQERMAVCIDPKHISYFIQESDRENLECTHVADVTDSGRLIMIWQDQEIVNLSREFLDTNGVQQTATVLVTPPSFGSDGKSENSAPPTVFESLNRASQKGLGEMFDGSVGASTVLWPFGGEFQITPPDAMVAKIPLIEGETDCATYMSWGFDPFLSEKSPFHGAAYAVTESVCKGVAAGAKLTDIRLTLQEFFPRLDKDPSLWGLPFAALLGAFRAQHELRLAAIGGKDSMSGTFNELKVPATLVSFALAPGLASLALSPEFKKTDSSVSLLEIPIRNDKLPDFQFLKKAALALHDLNQAGKILSLHHTGPAGLKSALTKMCLGNQIGFRSLDQSLPVISYFSFIIEHASVHSGSIREALTSSKLIGNTTLENTLLVDGEELCLSDLLEAFTRPLKTVYPIFPPEKNGSFNSLVADPSLPNKSASTVFPGPRVPRPRVLIPTFPGTNSEYDSARSFQRVGAETRIEVFRNLSPIHIEESLRTLAKEISAAQILFLPGGFSAGDEPDGAAKFIATILRNERIADAISDLLENRHGLILGICNGFQALVKTGLLPYGKVRATAATSPTLVHNDIARHVSMYVNTIVTDNSSPWLANNAIGAIHKVPVSHGQGKFVGSPETIKELVQKNQVATQYCTPDGKPSLDYPFNPNGSYHAIEGITSPCGKIFGKMAHSERHSENVSKNVPRVSQQPIFEAGVLYFS